MDLKFGFGSRSGVKPEWPMPLKTFLAGNHLKPADIVLMRRGGNIFSFLIRFFTRSHFSHVAIMVTVPEGKADLASVLEAVETGVKIVPFGEFLPASGMVIAIRRLNQDWVTSEVRSALVADAKAYINGGYDFDAAVRLGWRSFRWWAFGIRTRMQGIERALRLYEIKHRRPPSDFVCSGLVQLALLDATRKLIMDGKVPAKALGDVVFSPDLKRYLPTDWEAFTPTERSMVISDYTQGFADEFNTVSPNNLALTEQLTWCFVIRRGKVFPVQTREQALDKLKWQTDEEA